MPTSTSAAPIPGARLTIDATRGIAFVPTGSPTYDYYGADRIGANLFADCLLALDARTGKRLWHFQTVHHDLWDFDNNAAPQLTTIRQNGRSVDVVAMASKTGFLYVFNRETGEPIWPIEERPVPKSEMPGEQSWPTQPFPTKPAPFAKQHFTLDDINPVSQHHGGAARRVQGAGGEGPQPRASSRRSTSPTRCTFPAATAARCSAPRRPNRTASST